MRSEFILPHHSYIITHHLMLNWFRSFWPRWSSCTGSLGQRGEFAAERYLMQLGYRVLRRQHRNIGGELDLIALDGDTVVFVEVKTRRSVTHGQPVDAVDGNKQRRMTRAALVFLKQQQWMDRRSRFDIVAVVWPDEPLPPQITHYRHAFEAAGDS